MALMAKYGLPENCEFNWYVLKTDMEKYLPAALKKAIAGANGAPAEPYLLLQQQRPTALFAAIRASG